MVTARLSNGLGSGVPSVAAPMGGVATIVIIGLAFLVASVLVIVLGNRWRAS